MTVAHFIVGVASSMVTPRNRSGLLSTYLVIGYIGSMVPMRGMGWIADHWGLEVAICTFCTVIMVMARVTAVLFQRRPCMQSPRGES